MFEFDKILLLDTDMEVASRFSSEDRNWWTFRSVRLVHTARRGTCDGILAATVQVTTGISSLSKIQLADQSSSQIIPKTFCSLTP